jgi:hypothetical protein
VAPNGNWSWRSASVSGLGAGGLLGATASTIAAALNAQAGLSGCIFNIFWRRLIFACAFTEISPCVQRFINTSSIHREST